MSWFGNQDSRLGDAECPPLWGCRYTCLEAGTVLKLYAKVKNTHTLKAGKAVIGLYKNADRSKVGQTPEITVAKNFYGWISGVCPGDVSPQDYIIAIMMNINYPYGFVTYSKLKPSPVSGYKYLDYTATLPDPLPTYDGESTIFMNMYCEYAPSAPPSLGAAKLFPFHLLYPLVHLARKRKRRKRLYATVAT